MVVEYGKAPRGEVLVAIMNSKRDFGILQEALWYRIPVSTPPPRWPPEWLAFYQTKVFDQERWAVNYYGRVLEIRVRTGQEGQVCHLQKPGTGRDTERLTL